VKKYLAILAYYITIVAVSTLLATHTHTHPGGCAYIDYHRLFGDNK